jgi:hypothetical protein
MEQHATLKREQEEAVQADKNNTDRRTGGLWRGFFRTRPQPRRPFRDMEDGVDRCPLCGWELEDGMCEQCGLPFDENGTGTWDFSDEQDLNSEHDMELEMDMDDEDEDFMNDVFGSYPDWYDHGGVDRPYALQRMLAENSGLHPNFHRFPNARARAAHSAAGSRRRSYTPSVMSDMADSEMAIVEEEDEDGDSSMNDFIDDDEGMQEVSHPSSLASRSTSRASVAPTTESIPEGDEESTEDEGPIPPNRARFQRAQSRSTTAAASSQRPRQHGQGGSRPSASGARDAAIVEQPSGSDEDEDEGPIPPGRRHRSSQPHTQQPALQQAPVQRSRRRVVRDSSEELEAEGTPTPPRQHSPSAQLREQITQAQNRRFASPQLRESPPSLGYTPLGGRASLEEDLDEGDDESDGRRTTAGWEPIHMEPTRNAGSLTPTADRPNPPITSSISRTGSNAFPLGSRGLRRRSSILSTSTVHDEDNDADDDVSDGDPDSDMELNPTALRPQISQIRLRPVASQRTLNVNALRSQPFSDDFDIDSDETTSSASTQRGSQPRRRPEYNPRFSMVFAEHQRDLNSVDYNTAMTGNGMEQLRQLVRTPLARPRTSNRNRTPVHANMAVQNSMNSTAPVARSSQTLHSSPRTRSNAGDGSTAAPSLPNGRAATFPGQPRNAIADVNRAPAPPNRDVLYSSAIGSNVPASPFNTARMFSSANVHTMPPAAAPHLGDNLERPMSRMSSRAPSVTGRRGAPQWAPFAPPQISPLRPGLNYAQNLQTNNPFVNRGAVAPRRQPSQRLRNESSTATLRQRSRANLRQPSQLNLRETNSQFPQQERQQSSRTFRTQPTQRNVQEIIAQIPQQLHTQASRISLPRQPSNRALRLQQAARAEHVPPAASLNVRRHVPALGQQSYAVQVPGSHNPFHRRGVSSVSSVSTSGTSNTSDLPTWTNAAAATGNHANTHAPVSPTQPAVARRRSNRALANGGTLPGGFVPASSLQSAHRTRSGQSSGGSSIDSFSAGMARGVGLTTGGDRRGH